MSNNKLNRSVWNVVAIYAGLIAILILALLPFYVVLIATLTLPSESISTSFIAIPSRISTITLYEIFSDVQNTATFLGIPGVSRLISGFYNMFWQVVPKSIISLFVSGLGGYAYCKLQFRAKKVMFNIMLASMMLPMACMTIPVYMYYDALGWIDTVKPLIVGGLFGGASTTFFMKQFFDGIPTEIIEAARIDGLNEVGIYFKIMFPLAVPAFVSQFILGFVGGYNSYLGPMLYLPFSMEYWPIQLVLQSDTSIHSYRSGTIAWLGTKAILGIIPLIIVFMFGQKYFVGGATSGAVKG